MEFKSVWNDGFKFFSIHRINLKRGQVWRKYKSLNVAHGAICSSELKRRVREVWEKDNEWDHQAFGFDINEVKRAISISKNHQNFNL